MKDVLNRVGTWILLHPRLVTALVLALLVVASVAVFPALGAARPRFRP